MNADSSPAGADELSPLPGEICEQYIRCGKPGCRCEHGERHGPYYYRIWREGDRIHKVYVKRTDLGAVQRACQSYRDCQQVLRGTRTDRELLSRRIQQEWRQTQRLLRRSQRAA